MSADETLHSPAWDAEVIVVGAGPAGLMTANLLATYGVDVLVLEAGEHLIDYPRGVGLDDEALRAFQTVGLVGEVLPHTIPNQLLVFVDKKGKDLARIAPPRADFGWPRRNGFVQPLADRVLYEGLTRRENAEVRFSSTVTGIAQSPSGVTVTVTDADGATHTLRCGYLVGADGGRSTTRKLIGVGFPGRTAKNEWLVIDARNDPLGQPGAYVGADPRRPYACISIPHGIRRFEFMMLPGETAEDAEDDDFIARLLEPFVPRGARVDIIRRRVYSHQSRIADRFRVDRVLLVGDAAHLMPVWQGQGYNSGIRDAYNVAWKIAMVMRGVAGGHLLDHYELERRDHAQAMIQLSTWVGNVISVRNRGVAAARDALLKSLNLIPAVKRYILQFRFKPMPVMRTGAITAVGSSGEDDAVGRIFPQPLVATADAERIRLDDAVGPWFTLLAWNNDPRAILDRDTVAAAERAGIRLVEARPAVQLSWANAPSRDVVGDVDGSLKTWFDRRAESVVLIRPDRIVAGAAPAYAASAMIRDFIEVIDATSTAPTPLRRARARVDVTEEIA